MVLRDSAGNEHQAKLSVRSSGSSYVPMLVVEGVWLSSSDAHVAELKAVSVTAEERETLEALGYYSLFGDKTTGKAFTDGLGLLANR